MKTPLGQEASGGRSVRGHPHRSGFYLQEPHQVLPWENPRKILVAKAEEGDSSPCEGVQSLLLSKSCSLGGIVPELSPEDCPGLEEGSPHCNTSNLPLIERGREMHPSGEARVEFTAQGSATKREISSYDCRPLSCPRPMTTGQCCNNHDYRRQSCRIQWLCREAHREAQGQEAPDKGTRGTWSF